MVMMRHFCLTMEEYLALPASNIVPTVFRWGWLRFLGKYAYCLYIVHIFIMGILAHSVHDDTFVGPIRGNFLLGRLIYIAICTAASIAVALVSWHLFEKQFLKLKRLAP
jgi:peptidoglycan/LPS O-acetylase OafA/YrhL